MEKLVLSPTIDTDCRPENYIAKKDDKVGIIRDFENYLLGDFIGV